jgi:hypothetical protein
MATAEAASRPHGTSLYMLHSLCRAKHSPYFVLYLLVYAPPTLTIRFRTLLMRGFKDRQTTRKRPFAGWMRRLANLKPSSSDNQNGTGKKNSSASKKTSAKNNPYPESGRINSDAPGHLSFSTPETSHSHESFTSAEEAAAAQQRQHAKSTRSNAPTVATMPETLHSQRSKAETGNTNQNGGSTFSSPNGSEHSLTTTLTTIQSSAPSHILGGGQTTQPAATSAPPVHFSHQFPTSPPPSAIPPHLAPQQGPHSYQVATANNVLTDDASILTLASSSKRRRRNSLDTNASVRAMAPSSHYGGSRESLPLSVLSGNVDTIYSPSNRPTNVNGLSNANAERVSIYSVSGATAPVLSSERNSYYANKQADGLSVRSGLLGHGRTDSISSMRAMHTASPLASPRDPPPATKISRRSSEWIPDAREASDEDEDEIPSAPTLKEEEEEKEMGQPTR